MPCCKERTNCCQDESGKLTCKTTGDVQGAWVNLDNGGTLAAVSKSPEQTAPYIAYYPPKATEQGYVPHALRVAGDGELMLQIGGAHNDVRIFKFNDVVALLQAAKAFNDS